jgi:hypothetical protein
MNTDYGSKSDKEDLAVMDAHADETGQMIACAHEVLNTLGHGLLEKPYEHAHVHDFRLRGIAFLAAILG